MDYCRKCKLQTKSIGIPKFVKKNKQWRRISTCKICNNVKNNISKSPENIETEELFRRSRKNFETRHFIQKGICDTWQADLYSFYRPKGKIEDNNYNLRTKHVPTDNEYKQMLRLNNNYKYILNVIDTFSKYVWAVPLKTKTGAEVSEALLKIMNEKIPKKLHVDKGKEFYNKDVKKILEKHNIEIYSTGTENKASIIERFNRTLGDKLKPIIYKNISWLDKLPDIIKKYNNTYHRTIKMKPVDVNKKNEKELLNSVYNYPITNSKPKFEVGDRVRLSSTVDQFRNKLKTNWTTEVFTVSKVLKSNVNYYKVEGVDEGIYEQEMLLTKC